MAKTVKNNLITSVTRQQIADSMRLNNLWYHGEENEPTFLNRVFDLKGLPPSPWESRYDNAYDDIYQHTVNNTDYTEDWIYTDSRINLLHMWMMKYI